jgi:hypothetical protein
MTEAAILKILFPPDGNVPVDKLDCMQSIQEHIAALLALSKNKDPQPEPSNRSAGRQEVSQATTLRIVELREQPDANGHRRTWSEITKELGISLSPDAARHRYQAFKASQKTAEQKKTVEKPEAQAQELDDTLSVSNILTLPDISQEAESQAPSEKHQDNQVARVPNSDDSIPEIESEVKKPEHAAPEKSELSPIDETIMEMAANNSLPYEIASKIRRTFGVNLSTTIVAERIRKLKGVRNGHD